MTTLACYVSGHGLGHAVRVIEVLRRLARLRTDLRFVLRSPVPQSYFARWLDAAFVYAERAIDYTPHQRDSLTIDVPATLRQARVLLAGWDEMVDSEARALDVWKPALIFSDIAPVAFDVAARLGVPAVAMTNFSWDWIYAPWVSERTADATIVDSMRRAYGRAELLLRLPMHGDLGAFPRINDVPLVARRARAPRGLTRRRLGLSPDAKLVLISVGSSGMRLPAASPMPRVQFLAPPSVATQHPAPAWCRIVDDDALGTADLRYEDLVGAVDAVVSKPGYGIVSECLANGTPLVHTPRPEFAETAALQPALDAHLPHAVIPKSDLVAGRWAGALEAVLSRPRPDPKVPCNGAEVVAKTLAGRVPG